MKKTTVMSGGDCQLFRFLISFPYRLLPQPSIEERRCFAWRFKKETIEKLALLYLSKQDISGLSPEELLDRFSDAYERISARQKENKPEQRISY